MYITVDGIGTEVPVSVKLIDGAAYFLSEYGLSSVVTKH